MPQEEKTDLRIQKTEQALLDAMHKLLQSKPYDKITVSDLCSEANIRRATFYAHFKDKYDFLAFCIQKKQACFDASCTDFDDHDVAEYHIIILRDMLKYLQENKALFDHTTRHSGTMGAIDLFAGQMLQLFENKVRLLEQSGITLVAPPEIIATFFSSAMLGVARWWLMSEDGMTEDELIRHVQAIMTACMPSVAQKKEGNHERQPAKEQ